MLKKTFYLPICEKSAESTELLRIPEITAKKWGGYSVLAAFTLFYYSFLSETYLCWGEWILNDSSSKFLSSTENFGFEKSYERRASLFVICETKFSSSSSSSFSFSSLLSSSSL